MTNDRPLSLIAELTHRCPLKCVYCSNPLELVARGNELTTKNWVDAFQQAADLGVAQLHLTGGEPLARRDLTDLVAAARKAGLYSNLITSGVGLTADRLDKLIEVGLDHVQVSFQDVEEPSAREIAGVQAYATKKKIAAEIHARQIAFTINIVVHRRNLERLPRMIEMAESLGANRLEIAHVQYYGWALENRRHLLPTRAQVENSVRVVEEARARLKGKLVIDFVVPDYYAKYPKPCMGGWGRRAILMDPSGVVMPCHAAKVIPDVTFPLFPSSSLGSIWAQSDLFKSFRGVEWMQEPCRSCPKKAEDFGGCRCQAFLLTKDAAATDPVCTLSPNRSAIDRFLDDANSEEMASTVDWRYRSAVSSPTMSGRQKN